MPKCPTCSAEFSSEKLLSIHQKYCGRNDNGSDSDANFSTEKIRRSEIMSAMEPTTDTPVEPHRPIASATPPTPSRPPEPAPREPERPIEPELSPLDVAAGLDPEGIVLPTTDEGKLLGVNNVYEDSKGRLKLSVKPYEGLLLVKATGDLVVWTSLQLNSAIKKLVTSGGKYVILEVSEVEECDASGLGALLLFNQELKDRGGRLALTAPRERLERFECIKGFTRVIEFFPSLDVAVKAFIADKQ